MLEVADAGCPIEQSDIVHRFQLSDHGCRPFRTGLAIDADIALDFVKLPCTSSFSQVLGLASPNWALQLEVTRPVDNTCTIVNSPVPIELLLDTDIDALVDVLPPPICPNGTSKNGVYGKI